jgi:hypothetical protein
MNSEPTPALQNVADADLLRRLVDLASQSRRVEADLVAHIGEADARRLYARQAFPSMFVYCTESLRLSEAEAYRRITVARAARRFPALIGMLRDGRLHLSGLARLVPLLTAENCEALLARATDLTTRQVEALVAELAPRPDAPSVVRKLPQAQSLTVASQPPLERPDAELVPRRAPSTVPPELVARRVEMDASAPANPTPAPPRPPVIEALAPARYKVQFTASAALRDKLERLTALFRLNVPDGDLAAVFDYAVTQALQRLEARRFGKTAAPRKTLAASDTSRATRAVPAAVRRAVHERDGGRCRFVDDQGRRCSERHRLEFHHRHPFGVGGDHDLGNISLLCRAHNRLFAEHDYGKAAMRRHVSESLTTRDVPRSGDGG